MSKNQYDHIRDIINSLPHCKKIGLHVSALEQGRGKVELQPNPAFIGNVEKNLMHSAIVTTLLDTLCGAVASSAYDEIKTVATLDLRLDHLNRLQGDKPLLGRAECFHYNNDVAYIRGWAWQDNEENLVAKATGSFMNNGPFALKVEQ
ncbi:MAG: PaaI family thioesterase [Methylocystaceae bacterium]|nr:PaaI family thioesterase [Methylocystaceae bacterium]